MPLTKEQIESLSPLEQRGERHWRKHLPGMYEELLERGSLLRLLRKNAEAHENLMHRLVALEGHDWMSAQEIVNPMFLFLDPRTLGENPDESDLRPPEPEDEQAISDLAEKRSRSLKEILAKRRS